LYTFKRPFFNVTNCSCCTEYVYSIFHRFTVKRQSVIFYVKLYSKICRLRQCRIDLNFLTLMPTPYILDNGSKNGPFSYEWILFKIMKILTRGGDVYIYYIVYLYTWIVCHLWPPRVSNVTTAVNKQFHHQSRAT